MTDTSAHPDVIVVGGGILGAAVFYELSRHGVNVRLLEKNHFASGATGKSAAIVRMNYSNPPVVRMALRSHQIFVNFDELVGGAPIFYKTGWLLVVGNDWLDAMRATISMNRSEGVAIHEVPSAEIAEVAPGVSCENAGAFFLEPGSGFVDPRGATIAYVQAARNLGGIASEHARVRELVMRNGRVCGVQTQDELIEADRVILAAGPWSAKLAATIGLDLPLEITREEEAIYKVPPDNVPSTVVSSLVESVYLRPVLETPLNTATVLVGRGFPKDYTRVDPDACGDHMSLEFESDVRKRASIRLPQLADAKLHGSVVGMYAVTPDWHPYLGPAPGYDGLVLATGGSGHCLKLAPAIGEMVAGDLLGKPVPYADIQAFTLDRFRQGTEFKSVVGGNRA